MIIKLFCLFLFVPISPTPSTGILVFATYPHMAQMIIYLIFSSKSPHFLKYNFSQRKKTFLKEKVNVTPMENHFHLLETEDMHQQTLK